MSNVEICRWCARGLEPVFDKRRKWYHEAAHLNEWARTKAIVIPPDSTPFQQIALCVESKQKWPKPKERWSSEACNEGILMIRNDGFGYKLV